MAVRNPFFWIRNTRVEVEEEDETGGAVLMKGAREARQSDCMDSSFFTSA